MYDRLNCEYMWVLLVLYNFFSMVVKIESRCNLNVLIIFNIWLYLYKFKNIINIWDMFWNKIRFKLEIILICNKFVVMYRFNGNDFIY